MTFAQRVQELAAVLLVFTVAWLASSAWDHRGLPPAGELLDAAGPADRRGQA